jgi:CRP-like cAMP-binding protein
MSEPVSRRIIRVLLRLRGQFGDELPMTHRELAQMAWTSTETAIRAIRQLKLRGVLAGARRRIVVRDLRALKQALAAPPESMTGVIDQSGSPR